MVVLSEYRQDEPVRRNMMRHFVVKPGGAVRMILLHDRVLKLKTHYFNTRTRPCTKASGFCDGCEKHADIRPGLFIGVIPLRKAGPHLFIITEWAWAEAFDLRSQDGKLRGKVMEAERMGDCKQSPLRVKLVDHSYHLAPGQTLPLPNLLDALARMWRLPNISLGGESDRTDDFTPDMDIPTE